MSIGSGTRLGPYEVQDFIGQGAMGVVYRAYHSGLERTGAVKVMQGLTPDPDTVARFRHEAQAIARLRHPNIVDVYDFGEFEGSPYMIVEYVPGGSLAATMTHGPLERRAAVRYLRGIAAGLDYAHGRGVVHRDVKPANVLLAADDSPVLADFGLAKLLQGSSLKSMTGVTTGTPAYMAPEQVTGAQVGPAADRYSLATIAYEMLTGVIPFDGEALMELLYAQVHRYSSPPSARRPELGPDVDAVIMRGLAKNPSDRWESCAAFVDALEAALTKAPVVAAVAPTMVMAAPAKRAEPVTTTRPFAPAAPVQQTVPAPLAMHANGASVVPSPKPRTRGRRRLLIGLAAILALVVVLGVCAAVAQATTLTVNPSQAAPGETVRVTATHVPANQFGEIQLHSVLHVFPFRASGGGQVAIDMTVPYDEPLGDHVVRICWAGSCHKDAMLRVVSGAAEVLPAVSPTGYPTSSPAPHSTPLPRPGPTPTSNPCPMPPGPAALTKPASTVLLSSTIPVVGQNFSPYSAVTVEYYMGTALKGSSTVETGCAGSFSTSFRAAQMGSGKIYATDGARSATKPFTVVL